METRKGYSIVYVDIMVDGRFYRQIPYQYNPLWKLDVADVKKKVLNAYPNLCNKKYVLGFSSQRIKM